MALLRHPLRSHPQAEQNRGKSKGRSETSSHLGEIQETMAHKFRFLFYFNRIVERTIWDYLIYLKHVWNYFAGFKKTQHIHKTANKNITSHHTLKHFETFRSRCRCDCFNEHHFELRRQSEIPPPCWTTRCCRNQSPGPTRRPWWRQRRRPFFRCWWKWDIFH